MNDAVDQQVQDQDWRQQAEQAQRELEAARSRLAEVDAELSDARQSVAALERRQRVDQLLAESDAIDLEAARLLTEAAVAQMDQPDVDLAVADLRRHRPYLFRRRSSAAQVMAAQVQGSAPAAEAATAAAQSGDRRDLLRYLRLRRTV